VPSPVGFGWIVKMTKTNATMARKIPMSRTNRFERFKWVSPRAVCDGAV
jgi:hypothetical protein